MMGQDIFAIIIIALKSVLWFYNCQHEHKYDKDRLDVVLQMHDLWNLITFKKLHNIHNKDFVEIKSLDYGVFADD